MTTVRTKRRSKYHYGPVRYMTDGTPTRRRVQRASIKDDQRSLRTEVITVHAHTLEVLETIEHV